MKLISLTANRKSFHTITFEDGLNIVVGKQVSPHTKNDGNTYNGVGKSLIIHLIHFCLGSNAIGTFAEKLPDWEFTLKFKVDTIIYYSTRSTNNQNKINFNGNEVPLNTFRNELLHLIFDIEESPKNMTTNTLLSRFARRYRVCYSNYDTYLPKESDFSKILNNGYLLGIDTDLIIYKKELREKQKAAKETEKAIKKDAMFRQYYLGKSDAEIDSADLEYKINQLETEISEFKVSNNYHELEKEANEKSFQKKELENKRVLIVNYIKSIESAFEESNEAKQDKALKIYEQANIQIPEMVKKNIQDVLKFHNELINSRNTRLRKDLNIYKKELEEVDAQIINLGKRMDELLVYLNSYGALEEYSALTKQLNSLKNEFNRIVEYQKLLKSYKDLELNIKQKYLEQDLETNLYLETESNHITNLKNMFRNYSKKFYPIKRSGLSIKNNTGENLLRFSIDARIEDDSSDGVNEVRMFCFDLMVLLTKKTKAKFLFHDSRLFANMDPRQRETLFKIIKDVCETEDIQYICTINEDALQSFEPLMTKEEYDKIINENIRLELNDDSPSSKLLGIQIDMDLEDKEKSKGDLL